MNEMLMVLYYEGIELKQAIKIVESSFDKKVSNRTIENIQSKILKLQGKNWN